MTKNNQRTKLYAYIDESGQDTKGLIFVVSVLVFEDEIEKILKILEDAEEKSGKKNVKWNKSRYKTRNEYLEIISDSSLFKQKIFFEIFKDTKEYIKLTSFATAKAILRKAPDDYIATIFIDGFRKKEVEIFTRGIRGLQINTRKIRGVKKDENNAFIRLVDTVCGLVRDAGDGNEWALMMLKKLKKLEIISKL